MEQNLVIGTEDKMINKNRTELLKTLDKTENN